MKQLAKISIIIPVYNNEEHLRICMDSVVGQTMKEIEVICIDDASNDASLTILEEYAKKDERVCIIRHEKNLSPSQARKDGCLKSCGEYILFVDGDDYLLPKACECLYEEMQRRPVDILQFGAYILNYSYMPQSRIEAMRNFIMPLFEELSGKDVFEYAFRKKEYGFNLWNKFYDGDVCRRGMAQIEDGSFIKAEDKYAFMAIALEAGSYRGIPEKYYVYRFGSGMTGHEELDLKLFSKYVEMGKTADAIERFLEKKGLLEQYLDVYELNRRQLLEDVAINWCRLREEREKGLELLKRFWKDSEVQYVREKEMG